MADMMERNALRNAQANASQAEFLVNEAKKFSSAVQPVGRVSIAQGFVIQILLFLFTPHACVIQIHRERCFLR